MVVRRTRKATTRKAKTPNTRSSAESTAETKETMVPVESETSVESQAKVTEPPKSGSTPADAPANLTDVEATADAPKTMEALPTTDLDGGSPKSSEPMVDKSVSVPPAESSVRIAPQVPVVSKATKSTTSRRAAKTAKTTTTIKSTKQGNSSMTQEDVKHDEPKSAKVKASDKASIVKQNQSTSMEGSPVMPSEIEMVGTLQISGERPVAASSVEVFGTILNGRPIQASTLKIYEPLAGGSAIFCSDFHAVEGLYLPGGRPIMVSPDGLMQADKLPGDRPIFSNEIDDANDLMGFID